jgi:hypothetical protein
VLNFSYISDLREQSLRVPKVFLNFQQLLVSSDYPCFFCRDSLDTDFAGCQAHLKPITGYPVKLDTGYTAGYSAVYRSQNEG